MHSYFIIGAGRAWTLAGRKRARPNTFLRPAGRAGPGLKTNGLGQSRPWFLGPCWSLLYTICRMIRRVNMSEYNPSLLGRLNWGGGSFARSQYPAVVYMTFFPNDEIRKFFPGFDGTLSIE